MNRTNRERALEVMLAIERREKAALQQLVNKQDLLLEEIHTRTNRIMAKTDELIPYVEGLVAERDKLERENKELRIALRTAIMFMGL